MEKLELYLKKATDNLKVARKLFDNAGVLINLIEKKIKESEE
jgi:hypothetical protein